MKWGRAQVQLICTIGPACRSPRKIEALIKAGMNVARLHFSYSPQVEHSENIRRIRRASRKLGREVKILQDLSGNKVRLGNFARKCVTLSAGDIFTLTSRAIKGNGTISSVNLPELISAVRAGDKILLADGALILKAIALTKTDIRCRVIVGGTLRSDQAVHVPGKAVPLAVPTLKDIDDVRFGINHGVDWIAQTYVTKASEIGRLRRFIRMQGVEIPIVAKIERRKAYKNLASLVRVADLVMVARGDLGLELGVEQIGLAQKRIIAVARRAGKPAIVATELLFSMMEHDKPTRSEVTDVTNAILDGASALMLSGETAMGRFPTAAASMLRRISDVVRKSENQT